MFPCGRCFKIDYFDDLTFLCQKTSLLNLNASLHCSQLQHFFTFFHRIRGVVLASSRRIYTFWQIVDRCTPRVLTIRVSVTFLLNVPHTPLFIISEISLLLMAA